MLILTVVNWFVWSIWMIDEVPLRFSRVIVATVGSAIVEVLLIQLTGGF